MFTLSEGVDDKREVAEAEEEYIELVKPCEDPPEGFQAAEQPPDLVTLVGPDLRPRRTDLSPLGGGADNGHSVKRGRTTKKGRQSATGG